MVGISIIVPCYKRIAQTVKTIGLLFASEGWGSDYEAEIIVADSSPDDELFKKLTEEFSDHIRYVRPDVQGIASNKNRGAKEAKFPILIFCDSDMEVEPDTLIRSIVYLKSHPTVAGFGGSVSWKGGPHDGTFDRPRPEDRMEIMDGTTYVEAVYSRYFVTYADVFWRVGGYDEIAFLHRGEGSDLSCRYWRMGYPLTYDKSIVVHHIWDAPDAKAVRVSTMYQDIVKDMILLAYKYSMTDGPYKNFEKTIVANFSQLGDAGYTEMIKGVLLHLDFITRMKPYLDAFRENEQPLYRFPFLEVFSQKEAWKDCVAHAEEHLSSIQKGAEV